MRRYPIKNNNNTTFTENTKITVECIIGKQPVPDKTLFINLGYHLIAVIDG